MTSSFGRFRWPRSVFPRCVACCLVWGRHVRLQLGRWPSLYSFCRTWFEPAIVLPTLAARTSNLPCHQLNDKLRPNSIATSQIVKFHVGTTKKCSGEIQWNETSSSSGRTHATQGCIELSFCLERRCPEPHLDSLLSVAICLHSARWYQAWRPRIRLCRSSALQYVGGPRLLRRIPTKGMGCHCQGDGNRVG